MGKAIQIISHTIATMFFITGMFSTYPHSLVFVLSACFFELTALNNNTSK